MLTHGNDREKIHVYKKKWKSAGIFWLLSHYNIWNKQVWSEAKQLYACNYSVYLVYSCNYSVWTTQPVLLQAAVTAEKMHQMLDFFVYQEL